MLGMGEHKVIFTVLQGLWRRQTDTARTPCKLSVCKEPLPALAGQWQRGGEDVQCGQDLHRMLSAERGRDIQDISRCKMQLEAEESDSSAEDTTRAKSWDWGARHCS